MTSNLESLDWTVSSVDGNCVKNKMSLKLRLGRVFNSNGINNPKSPKSVSNSRGSSPNHGSPRASTRYSWQPGIYSSEQNRSPGTPESESSILSFSTKSSSNMISSSKNPSTPKSICSSTWYAADR